MNIIKPIKSKVIHIVHNSVFHINRWLNNYDDVIWLIGDGRSGTTWISDLINYDRKYREMFEPFHPRFIKKMNFLLPHQYVRAHDESTQLKKIATDVFTGKLTHRRIDSNNYPGVYKGLLIKDIFSNLFSYWVSLNFPKVKIVLLIRNPFSVALSKYKKKSWFWVTNPIALLNQKNLYEDYLYPFEELIRETASKNDYILNQVLIWSIINYIPLRQFGPDDIRIIFYEQVYTNPNQEISKLLSSDLEKYHLNLEGEIITSPSRFAGAESNIVREVSPINSWKNEMTVQQIDAGFGILEEFGFEKLYDNSSIPNRRVLSEIQSKV